MPRIINFAAQQITPEHFTPPPEKCQQGNPEQTIWNHYTDATRLFSCGVWQGEPCILNVQYGPHEEEFCVLLEGEVLLTGRDGIPHRMQAGTAFVVPGGFTGTWQNLTRVKKYYAIMLISDPQQVELAEKNGDTL